MCVVFEINKHVIIKVELFFFNFKDVDVASIIFLGKFNFQVLDFQTPQSSKYFVALSSHLERLNIGIPHFRYAIRKHRCY